MQSFSCHGSTGIPELPAELVAKAAEAMPDASPGWLAGLLRDCGEYGLELALLVLAWVKIQAPRKPARYAYTALLAWLNKLRARSIDMAGVHVDVFGPAVSRASPVAGFDCAGHLTLLAREGWTLIDGPDGVMRPERIRQDVTPWPLVSQALKDANKAHAVELKVHLAKGVSRGPT